MSKKYRDLEILVKGQSKSLKVVPFDRLCMVCGFLLFYSNCVPKRTIFEIFDFKKCRDLENPGLWVRQGHWEMSPFDRAHTTSYWLSIVTMALSRVVSEKFNVLKCHDLEMWVRGHSRSLKVVPFDRLAMHGFLLVFPKTHQFEIFDLKLGLGVSNGHQNRHGSIRHLWFPINVPQQPWTYLVPLSR